MLNKIIIRSSCILHLASCILFCFVLSNGFCQKVISSAGKSYSNSSGYHRFTIGEPAVKTFTGSNGTISEGFHQNLAPPCSVSVSISSVNVSCNGASNGSATVAVSGGSTPFSYMWNNDSTTSSIFGLPSSVYSVTVTDTKNCKATANVTIAQPSALTASVSKTDVNCNGACNGTATANVSGGTFPYSYLWAYTADSAWSAVSDTITGLCAGNYSVTATDANGCTKISFVTINSSSAITATFSSANTSCNSQCNGSTTLTINGGNSPYTYLWSTGKTTASLTGLCAGNYSPSVTVTDANGCAVIFTDSFTITQPDTLLSPIIKANACSGICSGSLTSMVTGGTAPYNYLWSNTQTTDAITNLCGGNYTLTVTDANGCTRTKTSNIAQSSSINMSFFKTDVNCFGGDDGTASVSVSGGVPSYSYLWSNGANSGAISNVSAGTYDVTVTDNNLCSATGSISLISPSAINLSFSVIPAACGASNGIATVSASGGTGPYSYNWSTGQTTSSVNGLAGGSYSVTVTDNKGCKKTGNVTVGTTSGFTASFTSTNIICSGINSGTATGTPSGGTTPYSYSWSNGATSATLTGLSAGMYSGTVTDNGGCSISGNIIITQPPSLNISLTGTNATGCGNNDGSAALTVNGGTSPYSYLWNTGATSASLSGLATGNYFVTVTDTNGCAKTKSIQITAPSSATLSFTKTDATCNGVCNGTVIVNVSGGTSPYSYSWSNGKNTDAVGGLCAGTYLVTVVDSAGCAVTDTVVITQPAPISILLTSNGSSCGVADGSASATVSGGTSPYNYQWSSGDTIAAADSLSSGVYTITVTDANGCSNFAAATISDVNGPNVTVNSVTHISCNGGANGAISINVTGGATPYTFNWSNGGITQNIGNLSAGPYEVQVTDTSGCTGTKSITVLQPSAMNISLTVNNATSCGNNDGNVIAIVSGGTASYSYLWSNSATTSTVNSLNAGIYTVTATDNKGCTITATAAVAEGGGPVVSIDSIVNPGCGGNGSVYVAVTGGTTPYSYNWSNGLSTEDLVGVSGGTYNLVVTDANSCHGALTANVIQQQPAAPEICLITVDTTLGTNKVVWEKLFGLGISAYKIYKETTQAGVYQLAGTRPFDSLSVFVDSVANPMQHSWRYKLSAVDSCGNESPLSPEHKTIHLSVSQGLGTIELNWDAYQGFSYPTYYIWRYKPLPGWTLLDSLQSNLNSYTDFNPPTLYGLHYFIEVRHPNGCTATKSENHNSSRSNKSFPLAPTPNNLMAMISANDATQGICNGSASLTVNGGITPYSYLWSNGDTTQTTDSLCAGNYSCTITDSEGATTITTVTINQTGINLSASATATDATQGNCDGTATVTATGGVSPYSYLWNDSLSQTTATATGLCAGNYSVTVTDSLGNTFTTNATVGVQPGIFETGNNMAIKLYPNPSKGIFTLENTGGKIENGKIIIYNTLGERVFYSLLLKHQSQVSIDISKNANGVYYLQVFSERGASAPMKIILQR